MSYITYTVNVSNDSPENAAENIVVAIPDPTGLTYDSIISGTGWSSLNRQWSIGTLNAGEGATLEIRYTVTIVQRVYSLAAEIVGITGYNAGINDITSDLTPWWLVADLEPSDVAGAWQAVGASTIANSYINLNDPGTNDMAGSAAPSFDTVTGWTFNGVDQCITNGITLESDNSLFVAVAADTSDDNSLTFAGSGERSQEFFFSATQGGNATYQKGASSASKAGGAGIRGIVRLDDGYDYALDPTTPGALLAPALGNEVMSSTIGFAIGAGQAVSGPRFFAPGTVKAAVVYSTPLSTAQALAVGQAMSLL